MIVETNTRRDFLKTLGFGSAALMTGAPSSAARARLQVVLDSLQ